MCDTLFVCLAKDRLDTGMGILDERTGITVEVDRLLRVEEHGLARVNLEDEILQGTKAYHLEEFILFLCRKIVDLSKLERSLLCSIVHICDKVIGINNSSLTRLHLTFRKFDHTI